jgi:hypothetical protein
MDLLREYDFDCLPLIDRVRQRSFSGFLRTSLSINCISFQEFDNPVIQSAVHAVIAAEMRSFAPADYLAYLTLSSTFFCKFPGSPGIAAALSPLV